MLSFLIPPLIAVAGVVGTGFTLAATNPDTVGSAVTGAGAAAAVGAVIWIARKVIAGEVVPMPIKALTESQNAQNAQLTQIVKELLEGKRVDRDIIREATQALYGVREYVKVVESFPTKKEPIQ